MFEFYRKTISCTLLFIFMLLAAFMYGCGSVSSDNMPVGSSAGNVSLIRGRIFCNSLNDLGYSGVSLAGCEVWPENNVNNRVLTDSNGEFQFFNGIQGSTRLIAQLKCSEGVYIGRSNFLAGTGYPAENEVLIFEINKGVNYCSFRLNDAEGNVLNDSLVRPSIWGIPAVYDRSANLWRGPLLPPNTAADIKISGSGFREKVIPVRSDSNHVVYNFTCSKYSESETAPCINSVVSSSGRPLNTDFQHSGLHDLDLSVSYISDSPIMSCSWNDGGLGQFIRKDETCRSSGRSSALWRPLSADAVGTITFSITDINGNKSLVELGVNSSLSLPPETNVPNVNNFAVSFDTLDNAQSDTIYNPTYLPFKSTEDVFRVKINITGFSSNEQFKNGSVKQGVTFEGCKLVENGDESPENVLSGRVYTLQKPSAPGVYTIKVTVTDNMGRTAYDEYDIQVDAAPKASYLSVSPEQPFYDNKNFINLCAYANDEDYQDALKFTWFISGIKVFEETKHEAVSLKVSKFIWNDACKALPLDETLPDGKYEIKCRVTDAKGNTEELKKDIIVSAPIQIDFLKDDLTPPKFNPTYREASDPSYFELKALVLNKTKENISKIKWEYSINKSGFKEAVGTSNVVSSGLGSTVTFTIGQLTEPGSYTFRLSVTDSSGRTDMESMEELYVDFEPELLPEIVFAQDGFNVIKYINQWDPNRPEPVSLRRDLDVDEHTFYEYYGPEEYYLVEPNKDFSITLTAYDEDINDPIEFKWEIYEINSYYWDDEIPGPLVYSSEYVSNSKVARKQNVFVFPARINKYTGHYNNDAYIVKCTIRDKMYNNPSHVKEKRILVSSGCELFQDEEM